MQHRDYKEIMHFSQMLTTLSTNTESLWFEIAIVSAIYALEIYLWGILKSRHRKYEEPVNIF